MAGRYSVQASIALAVPGFLGPCMDEAWTYDGSAARATILALDGSLSPPCGQEA